MTRRVQPPQKARDSPAPTSGVSLRDLIGMGLLWLLITAGMLFFVLPIIAQQTADEAALKSRGVSTTAQALRVWSTPGGRGGPAYHLTFRFNPEGRPSPAIDEAYISAHEAAALRVPSTVPIVYDPSRLAVAALNIDDEVHRRHPRLEGLCWSAFVVALMAAIWRGTPCLRGRRCAVVEAAGKCLQCGSKPSFAHGASTTRCFQSLFKERGERSGPILGGLNARRRS